MYIYHNHSNKLLKILHCLNAYSFYPANLNLELGPADCDVYSLSRPINCQQYKGLTMRSSPQASAGGNAGLAFCDLTHSLALSLSLSLSLSPVTLVTSSVWSTALPSSYFSFLHLFGNFFNYKLLCLVFSKHFSTSVRPGQSRGIWKLGAIKRKREKFLCDSRIVLFLFSVVNRR